MKLSAMYFFLFTLLIGVVGLLFLMRVMADFQPGERKLQADLKKMREEIAAYSYKRYVSSKLNALLYVRTSEREFVYRFKGKEVQIVVNGQPLGTIKENGVLYSARDGKLLARVNPETAGLLPVVTKERELGSITATLPSGKPALRTRAFEFVKDNLSDEEETLFLSIALMELVKRSVE